MNESISNQNAQRLAHLSVIFCLMNEIQPSDELCHALAGVVMVGIMKWYEENGRTDFNPQNELICDDAIKSAFGRAQEIVTLANISVQTGIGMEGLTN